MKFFVKNFKNFLKNFKKTVDKILKKYFNNKAPCEKGKKILKIKIAEFI